MDHKPQNEKGEGRPLVRLHKYLAECGVASRRKSEELIEAGKVRVDGQLITRLGTKIDPETVTVEVSGTKVTPKSKVVLLFNKPPRVVSTRSDPQGRSTVQEFLDPKYSDCFPVGRLDFESSGLMIFTNDGELADRLLHPSYEVVKIYEVMVKGRVTDSFLEQVKKGVELEDGYIRGEAEVVERKGNCSKVKIEIREGRKRIVRRLCAYLQHPVIDLMRVAHGPFQLGELRLGKFSKVSFEQYQQIRSDLLSLKKRRKTAGG